LNGIIGGTIALDIGNRTLVLSLTTATSKIGFVLHRTNCSRV